MSTAEVLETIFPNLRTTPYAVTSPEDAGYNCVAWAMGDTTVRWWPASKMGRYYWPHWPPRDDTVESFVRLFRSRGFECCEEGELDPAFERIAIYAKETRFTHVARQLASGKWTSKLGRRVDIEHTLEGLEGTEYGTVAQFLRRPIPAKEVG